MLWVLLFLNPALNGSSTTALRKQ